MPHSSIFPLSYSKEVYRAIGRITVESKGPANFIELVNQANVLNFTLTPDNDPRSKSFIMHMSEITEEHNSDLEGHSIIMFAALEALEKRDG